MPHNFTANIYFDRRNFLAVIVPALRKDGMHYEVNVPGFPRFHVKWSVLDRYDIVDGEGLKVPDGLVIAISDVIERKQQ